MENRKKPRRAVALRYDAQNEPAPKVIAKGDRLVADKIVELAEQYGVHIHHDPDLAALLGSLDVDTYIPEPLYLAVAEVLAFVYRLNEKVQSDGTITPSTPRRPSG